MKKTEGRARFKGIEETRSEEKDELKREKEGRGGGRKEGEDGEMGKHSHTRDRVCDSESTAWRSRAASVL